MLLDLIGKGEIFDIRVFQEHRALKYIMSESNLES